MHDSIADGVWPTMVTPFTDLDRIDENALAEMVEWYLDHEVDGLFAICQSSEMFYLTLAERVQLSKSVVSLVDGRVEVIASGHISLVPRDQATEVERIAGTGVNAVVLVTNRFALEGESDDVWKLNLERFLEMIPDSIPLGFYECPYPYKRLLTAELMAWCAGTGRFIFLKDTSCDMDQIEDKLAVAGAPAGRIKLFNANAATLLGSLRAGAAGYSGVMGNFHPELYSRLCRNWKADPDRAEELQAFLGVTSVMEARAYPVGAKYHLQLEGIPLSLRTRARPETDLITSFRREVEQLRSLVETQRCLLGE